MQFLATIMALAATAAAGKVTFWTLDDAQRTVHFTGNPGSEELPSVVVNNKENKTVEFPSVWTGNYYAVKDGEENVPGMLGEVNFSGWIGLTYFDVSAIVDPHDKDNVKQMWPVGASWPMSGCEEFPCDNAYWHSDDIQTKVTDKDHIMTTLGQGSTGVSFAA